MPRSGSVGCAVRPIAVIFQVEIPGYAISIVRLLVA